MKVSDILRVKGNTLFTATPDQALTRDGEQHARAGHRLIGGHGRMAN